MPAGYDSWTDEIERGEGYAIGGAVHRNRVKTSRKWRAAAAHLVGLALLDLAILLASTGLAWWALVWRSKPLFVLAAVAWTFTLLFFRHQRLEHEKRR